LRDRGTILVVDDDAGVLNLLERFLSRQGFRVVTASGGARALELARSVRPAAITLDVVMPDMDGWSVLRSLKADPELSAIPVIVVTMTDDMAQGFALGAADFLTKPIDRARLLSLLAKLRPPAGQTNVLVVEDDPASREMLERLLVKEGCTVRAATNGVEALAAVAAELPDLMLLDLMMPEMNGFEVVAELMRNPEWSRIPIVVVTAKELTAEDRKRLSGQVTRVFRKGAFSRDELLAELGRLLEKSAAAPAPRPD
jgi:CheY-like chemotaxis protein